MVISCYMVKSGETYNAYNLCVIGVKTKSCHKDIDRLFYDFQNEVKKHSETVKSETLI